MGTVRSRWCVLATLALVACATVQPAALEPSTGLGLQYRISVSAQEVRVRLEVRGRVGERLPFQVPGSLGAGHDFRIVSDVEATDGRGASVAMSAPAPNHWEFQVPEDGRLVIRYRVRTDFEAHHLSLNEPGGGEMPTLDERQVFFPGALVLMAPSGKRAVQGPISVEWQVPPGWQVLTPFGEAAPDLLTLLDNYLAAGKFSRVTTEVPGGLQLDIAWFGDGDVARSVLPGLISRVFGAAVELMGGRAPTSRYVILLRSDFPSDRAQGSPREGSIQVHLPRDVPLERVQEYGAPNPPVLLSTLAHEYLHTWGRERGEGTEESEGPEPGGELRWFEEGFVHYLAYLALLRSGVVDLAAFQSTIMGRAYASVLKNPRYGQVSLVQASERFFVDPESRQFAYSGGMVVAFLCDMDLRARGLGSLERFLDELPPGRHVDGWARWSEAWAKKTGSPEPVASWVGSTAPLPFHEYWERSDRWIQELATESDGRAEAATGGASGTTLPPAANSDRGQ